jgi:hypothetical protein
MIPAWNGIPSLPRQRGIPPIDSLAVEAAQPRTNKGKQPVQGTWQPREDHSDNELKTQKMMKKRRKLTKRLSKAIVSNANDDENRQPGRIIVVKVCLCFLLFVPLLTEP